MPPPELLHHPVTPVGTPTDWCLNFTMQPQQQTEWCWAAVSVSVSLYFNPSSSWIQCSLANAQLNQTTCCQNGASDACNQPSYLDQALTLTGNLASWQPGTLTPAWIMSQIYQGLPIGARIGWTGDGGHFVILAGYNDETLTRPIRFFLDIQDPWYGHSWYELNAFTNDYQGAGSWTHTYFLKP